MRAIVAVLTPVLLFSGVGPAAAQSSQGHAPAGHGLGTSAPDQPSPGHGHPTGVGDAGPVHQRVAAYLREFDEVIASGRGFGLAFAADQNGYPGPLHVLELRQELGLTADQETRIASLFDAMLTEARAKAARLAAAEAQLRTLFADGIADPGRVSTAVADAEVARAEVRLVHLLSHVKTREVLTEAQRHTYHRLRWGTAAKNP